MNNARLYHESNALQKKDTYDLLMENSNKIKWKKDGAKIIDVGCGDGSVTMEVLKPHLPANHGGLLGCDISESMVCFARKMYKGYLTDFTVLDIGGKLPQGMIGKFDHLFSFFALHWILDQRVTFTNISKLLTDEGDCLLIFPGRSQLFDMYRRLACMTRWRPYLTDVERFVSHYHDVEKPEQEIKRRMKDSGFIRVEIKCHTRSFTFNSTKELKNFVAALTPFPIPEHEFDDYLDDYVSLSRAANYGHGSFEHEVIVVYGSKVN